MWFQWFIFVFDLLIPVLMILSGKAMQNHCPKNINGMIGYRTPRSMKNMDTWKYAHEYCGGLLRRIMAEDYGRKQALKRTFTNEGVRK